MNPKSQCQIPDFLNKSQIIKIKSNPRSQILKIKSQSQIPEIPENSVKFRKPRKIPEFPVSPYPKYYIPIIKCKTEKMIFLYIQS